MSEHPIERKRGDGYDKKKKKAAIVKVAHKARLDGSSNNGGDNLGADPFSNLDIIRDLTDKFALPGEGKVIEAECLTKEKVVENDNLREVLQKEGLVLTELKAALALEEEKKKEAKIKITKLEVKMSKSISEAAARAIKEFKALPK
ncbi:hypothetical protein COCNU_scaffold009116G000010 [Cocos nucifera]|nr:hypothetical protein [Cocos nucifera]